MLKIALAALTAAALAGCGGNIQDNIRDQYPTYARQHGMELAAIKIDTITCDKDATKNYDGWCRIRPKGFHLTFDVPYRGTKPLWGDAGVSEAP